MNLPAAMFFPGLLALESAVSSPPGFLPLACRAGLVLLMLLSLPPARLARGLRAPSLYLPVAGTILYFAHESLVPAGTVLRPERVLVNPLLLFLWLNGLARAGLLATLWRRAGGDPLLMDAQPHRGLQMLFTVPPLLLGGLYASHLRAEFHRPIITNAEPIVAAIAVLGGVLYLLRVYAATASGVALCRRSPWGDVTLKEVRRSDHPREFMAQLVFDWLLGIGLFLGGLAALIRMMWRGPAGPGL